MKEGWTYEKLGEVCDTINGLWKGKKPPFVNVGVIRNANFTKDFTLRFDNIEYLDVEERQYSKRKLQKGDLIVEKSGGSEKQPVGRAVLFDRENGEFSFSNFTSVLRIKDKNTLLSEFLYKYLLFIYKRGDTSTMQKATTGIHNIEFEKYLNIDVPCIPLSEQRSIVTRLDAAFSHIDALKANAEKQLNEARKLFQAELTECMKPKEGWEEKKLGEVSSFQNGFAFKSNLFKKEGSPIIRISNIQNESIQTDDIVYFDKADYPINFDNYKIYPQDILIAMSGGTTGKLGINTTDSIFYQNQRVGVIRENKKFLDHRFLFYFLQTKSEESLKIAAGAAQPNLSTTQIKGFIMPVPLLEVQRQIVSHLDSLSSNIRKLEELQQKTIAECDALKQAMLREVFE